MKKFLFSLICLFFCSSFVSAKIQLNYDWGEYIVSDDLLEFGQFGEDIGFLLYDEIEDKILFRLYDKISGQFSQKEFEDLYNIYIIGDKIFSFTLDYEEQKNYQYVFDKDLNLIKKIECGYVSIGNYDKSGYTDKYYFIDDILFDKETFLMVNVDSYVQAHELYDEYSKALDEGNNDKADELYFNIVKEEFSGTSIVAYAFIEYLKKDVVYSYSVVDYNFGKNGEISLTYYDYYNDRYYIEIYNSNYELITVLSSESMTTPFFMFQNNEFYLLECILNEENSNDDYKYYLNLNMTEYDETGNKLDSINLTNSLENDKYEGIRYDLRRIFNVYNTIDGFYLITQKSITPMAMDPTIDEEEDMIEKYPTIQKFSFVYNVETKKSDNGSIVVEKEESKSGEEIKYVVQPKDGYKLDKVIVIDDRGKTIEIKEDSFIMPNSNVTIEAIFIVDNPNTSVFIGIGIGIGFLMASWGVIVLKNLRVKQYE